MQNVLINKPKMIIFDYGQTLIQEERFDGIAGTKAVLEKCVENPNGITAEEVQEFANELNKDIGRYDPETRSSFLLEVHNHPFQNYLYDYFGLKRITSPLELETVFWDSASPGKPTEHIKEFLAYLESRNIRSAAISNIAMSGQALENRIKALLPANSFEFIIASSEYVFRKPHRRIFEIAAKKAQLEASDFWYCGDDVVCDVDGAKAAGLFSIWYKGAYEGKELTPKDEYLTILDWIELKEKLDELL